MTTPKTINGYPIVRSYPTKADYATRSGHVIIVDRGKDSYQRWVTAWLADGDSSWCWGHYIDTLGDAILDYRKRVETMTGNLIG